MRTARPGHLQPRFDIQSTLLAFFCDSQPETVSYRRCRRRKTAIEPSKKSASPELFGATAVGQPPSTIESLQNHLIIGDMSIWVIAVHQRCWKRRRQITQAQHCTVPSIHGGLGPIYSCRVRCLFMLATVKSSPTNCSVLRLDPWSDQGPDLSWRTTHRLKLTAPRKVLACVCHLIWSCIYPL